MQRDEIQQIPIDQIVVGEQMIRTDIDEDHVSELALSIASHGLLQPIVVTPIDENRYQLQAGYHRLLATKFLRKSTISAMVRHDDTGSTKTIALTENLMRRDLTLAEECECVTHLHNTERLSIAQMCAALSKSRDWVQRRLMIPNLPDDLKLELYDGNISISHAEVLCRIEDDNYRRMVTNQVMQIGCSVRQTSDLVEVYLATPSIEDAIERGTQVAQEIEAQKKTPRRCDCCGRPRGYENMRNVWVCIDGCVFDDDADDLPTETANDVEGGQDNADPV